MRVLCCAVLCLHPTCTAHTCTGASPCPSQAPNSPTTPLTLGPFTFSCTAPSMTSRQVCAFERRVWGRLSFAVLALGVTSCLIQPDACQAHQHHSFPATKPHHHCHLASTGSEQHTFVLTDLAQVDRTRTPWVVAGGHRPLYISSTNHMRGDGDQAVAADLRNAFEEAFVQYKVGGDVLWRVLYQLGCVCVKTFNGG